MSNKKGKVEKTSRKNEKEAFYVVLVLLSIVAIGAGVAVFVIRCIEFVPS